ncbi:MAG: ABC transporter, permease protein 1 (cluster 1, maltose/g3p/polyamine/iron) [uncultured Corynebacteriales bacterium]|uniref:ABC transporter, permease protein 1 (Cluster 1, maltose/g3p/polyamine/iron) n=1 Tax=uncultured Mycobacteriales bacterium TaxID=581187 RepID=A0A6J4I9T0_9ACTN|nr:MAG: ABC transporter, permease protein 1 (cluster 1, maltose/g3p/polyamine/iron) [uncultured Corynebacteriales bacterium]
MTTSIGSEPGTGGQGALAGTVQATAAPPRRSAGSALRRQERWAGWLFVLPALAILGVFLVVPIGLAFWVSLTRWDGLSSPFGGGAEFVGLGNYRDLITVDSLTRQNFVTSVRNNFYFVLFTVPLQTALALSLAVLLNNRFLRGRSFFRTAFFFPSITSSIATTLVFLFLFSGGGAVNELLAFLGIDGPNWTADSRGVFHQLLRPFGVDGPPAWAQGQVVNLSWWDWLAGPSITLCVIIALVVWTTSGTFMLMFLAGLQNINEEVLEAAEVDGATGWQRFRLVTLPMLRPTLILVLTLGLISTWQVFDQIYLTGNNPATITPAYLSYSQSFQNSAFGVGAAIAFLLFALIIVLASVQRRLVGTGEED